MSSYNDRETISTCRFGARAKRIKNKVVQNAERSAKELLIKLNEAESKIKNVTEVVRMLQVKLKEMIQLSTDEVLAQFEKFKEEFEGLASAKDIDYLFATLKG